MEVAVDNENVLYIAFFLWLLGRILRLGKRACALWAAVASLFEKNAYVEFPTGKEILRLKAV